VISYGPYEPYEPPFSRRAREVNSPERRQARADFQERRYGSGAILPVAASEDHTSYPYDPREVWKDLAANPAGESHNFTRHVGYDQVTGEAKYATDMNAFADFIAPRKAAQAAESTSVATWGPGSQPGSMAPTNDLAGQIEQAARDRYEAAQLRLQAERLRNPMLRTIG